jgi:hypothetical protein
MGRARDSLGSLGTVKWTQVKVSAVNFFQYLIFYLPFTIKIEYFYTNDTLKTLKFTKI